MFVVIKVDADEIILLFNGDWFLPCDVDVLADFVDFVEDGAAFVEFAGDLEPINPGAMTSSVASELNGFRSRVIVVFVLSCEGNRRLNSRRLKRKSFADELHDLATGAEAHRESVESVPVPFIVAEGEHVTILFRNVVLKEGDFHVTNDSCFF